VLPIIIYKMEYDAAVSVSYKSPDPVKNLKLKVNLQKKSFGSDLRNVNTIHEASSMNNDELRKQLVLNFKLIIYNSGTNKKSANF
jgi:hypothetical protein